jgi:hypothetical protein
MTCCVPTLTEHGTVKDLTLGHEMNTSFDGMTVGVYTDRASTHGENDAGFSEPTSGYETIGETDA